ncbi:tyrosine-type recombinase/integrase [Methanosarcina mazei]|uniref:tyrosine-type recombinase/integrase n=2 Tax=Methanosarcina mazei TaxID=2209 RepID=UPI001C340BF0|nr:tyrosine-type recombinase/integrase [Methanosarcina mazei]BBL63964.1 hypothetical protein MmazTMA_09410 [Methanosarcina mazei]
MDKMQIEENSNKKKSKYELILEEFDVLKTYEKKLKLKIPKESTVKTKVWAIVPFLRFTKNKEINQVTKDDVEDYYLSIKDVKKTNTTRRYMIELRYFFKTFKIDNNFFEDLKIKKDKTRLDPNEILTKDEAMKIVQHARNYRDRALIFLLWDSAARLSELLNLKKKDVYFDVQGATITVDGKTKQRIIRLTDSFSDLDELYKKHTGKQDDFLFCLPDGKQLSAHGVENIVSRAAKRAGIDKKVYPHLFRHSKLTWLAKHKMMEMHMRIFAGWSEDSDMPATYLHLSNEDVQDIVMEIAGMKTVEKEKEVDTSIKYCPRCNTMNSFDAIYCRHCSMILDQVRANPINPELEQHKKEVEKELLKIKVTIQVALTRLHIFPRSEEKLDIK